MIIGMVGSEEAKFTDIGRERARIIITQLIDRPEVSTVVSGKCHLGGIDIWAIEIAKKLGKDFIEFPPRRLSWEFYKARNLIIAEQSDVVYCITVDRLPPNYLGMRFDSCYHCKTNGHIKSGGCWTMRQAIKMSKRGELYVVQNS